MNLYIRDLGAIHTYGTAGPDPIAAQFSLTEKQEQSSIVSSLTDLYNLIVTDFSSVILKLSHVDNTIFFLLARLITDNVHVTIHWYSSIPPIGILASKLVIFLKDVQDFKNKRKWLTNLKEHDIIVFNVSDTELLNNLIILCHKNEIKASLWFNKLFIEDSRIIKESGQYPNLLNLYPYTLGA